MYIRYVGATIANIYRALIINIVMWYKCLYIYVPEYDYTHICYANIFIIRSIMTRIPTYIYILHVVSIFLYYFIIVYTAYLYCVILHNT